MQYINYFVSPESNPNLVDARLSAAERNIITQSVNTINSWNVLCDQGVSIAMSTDPDVQYIQQASNTLKTKTEHIIFSKVSHMDNVYNYFYNISLSLNDIVL